MHTSPSSGVFKFLACDKSVIRGKGDNLPALFRTLEVLYSSSPICSLCIVVMNPSSASSSGVPPSVLSSQPSTAALVVSLPVVPATSAPVLPVSEPAVPMSLLSAQVVPASVLVSHPPTSSTVWLRLTPTDLSNFATAVAGILVPLSRNPLSSVAASAGIQAPPTHSGSFRILLVVAVAVFVQCLWYWMYRAVQHTRLPYSAVHSSLRLGSSL